MLLRVGATPFPKVMPPWKRAVYCKVNVELYILREYPVDLHYFTLFLFFVAATLVCYCKYLFLNILIQVKLYHDLPLCFALFVMNTLSYFIENIKVQGQNEYKPEGHRVRVIAHIFYSLCVDFQISKQNA